MLKNFHLIKVEADNHGLGLSCPALHTCCSGARRQNSIKIQQILTTAEHSWVESLIVYQVANLSLWVKTGQDSAGVSSDHQQSAGRKLWSSEIAQLGGSSLSCSTIFFFFFL